MSLKTNLPTDWSDLKIEDKIIFINTKIGLISYHPPMEINNLDIFLNIYQFQTKKEEMKKIIKKLVHKENKENKEENQKIIIDNTEFLIKSDCSNTTNTGNFLDISDSLKLKEIFDSQPITDQEKIKIIKGFWENNKVDIQMVLRKVINEKYKTTPNLEYFTLGSDKKPIFRCLIKIRNDYHLCFGESDISKNKAREMAVNEGLKILVPNLYKEFNKKSPINLCNINMGNSSSLFTDEEVKFDDVINLDSENSISRIISNNISEINYSGDFYNYSNFSNYSANSIKPKNEFLSKKRRQDENIKDDKKINKKVNKKAFSKSLVDSNNRNNISDDYEEECVFGGCLKEEDYGSLKIDDPNIVDKYLSCSNYTPVSILNTFKVNNPQIDIVEKIFVKNDGIKFEKLKNDNYTKVVILSDMLNIKTECSSDNKKIAREYCAQKFLKKLYEPKFSKWVDLVKYFEEKRYVKDKNKFPKIK